MDELNAIFSDYDPSTELSRLSKAASQKQKAGPELYKVLRYAQRVSRKTGGAFDLSIGPLSKLWRRAFRQQQFPKLESIEAAREMVDFKQIRLLPGRKVRLKSEGMRLDAGGIAKGYALDEAMQVIREEGIHSVLIDGGGDLLLADPPPGKKGWAVMTPIVNNSGEQIDTTILLSNVAVATSGDTYRYLDWEGRRYSHIIDPRTGMGVSHGAMVTVVAAKGWMADALASAVSVLGPEEGMIALKKFRNCHLQIIVPKGEKYLSLGNLTSNL